MFWSMIVDDLSPELPAMAVIIILVSARRRYSAFWRHANLIGRPE
jgi:hypothetical protein